jgi:outer membrane immunogenic protein
MTRAAILLGAASVALFFSPAFGADTYSASSATGSYKGTSMPFVSWNGLYLGVNGGGAWGTSKNLIVVDGNPAITADVGNFELSGGFGGGQIGYNLQGAWSPSLVLGFEADLQGAGISDRFSRSVTYFHPTTFEGSTSTNYFGTARGRVGFATGSALIFGTGGFAYGNVTRQVRLANDTFTNNLSDNNFGVGLSAGGGIEYRLTPEWSVKVEYQYVDLGNQRLQNVASDNVVDSTAVYTAFSTVRVGLNYFVNPAYRPLQ